MFRLLKENSVRSVFAPGHLIWRERTNFIADMAFFHCRASCVCRKQETLLGSWA